MKSLTPPSAWGQWSLSFTQVGFNSRYWLHCQRPNGPFVLNLRVSRTKIENLNWPYLIVSYACPKATTHAPHNHAHPHNHACPPTATYAPCNHAHPPATTHSPATMHAPHNHAHQLQPCMPPATMHAPPCNHAHPNNHAQPPPYPPTATHAPPLQPRTPSRNHGCRR